MWSEFRLCFEKGFEFKDAFVSCDLPLTSLQAAQAKWADWATVRNVVAYNANWGRRAA